MTDESTKQVPILPVEPIKLAIIGNGTDSGLIVTSGDGPNIKWKSVTPLIPLAIRFAYSFATTFSGLLTATLPSGSILHGASLKALALIALTAAVVDGVKNLVTVLGKLESRFPLSTGSV